jgi:hypothetical protein
MPGTALPRGNATGPCNWPVSYAGCVAPPFSDGSAEAPSNVITDTTGESIDDTSPSDDQLLFESIATTYLWEWTGRRYGLCTELIRPCRRNCEQIPTFWAQSPEVARYGLVTGSMTGLAGGWLPLFLFGGLGLLGCGSCGQQDQCSCKFVSSLRLPGPVASVTEILVNGSVLSTADYRLDGPRLVRTDGGHWPECQDMSLDTSQSDTWSIEYQRGLAVPPGGQVAAGVLAAELAKAACGDNSCALPQRVQTITRQGVTIAMLDDFKNSLDSGYTGIWVVDSWISSVTRPPMSAIVVSPDFRRPGRTW